MAVMEIRAMEVGVAQPFVAMAVGVRRHGVAVVGMAMMGVVDVGMVVFDRLVLVVGMLGRAEPHLRVPRVPVASSVCTP